MSESTKQDGRPAMQFYPSDWWGEVALRLCSLAAQGLWINMLCIMWDSKPRGMLLQNGKPLAKWQTDGTPMAKQNGKTMAGVWQEDNKPDGKDMAKLFGTTEEEIVRLLVELKEKNIYSVTANGVIFNRRMYREWKKEEKIRGERAEAGRLGAEARWQEDGKPIAKGKTKGMAKMATSTSSSTSSSTSNISTASEKTPTAEMFKVFTEFYLKDNTEPPKFTKGKDGEIAKTLWLWCREANPLEPMAYYRQRVAKIWKMRPDIKNFGGIKYFWNWGADKKETPAVNKPAEFIPVGARKK